MSTIKDVAALAGVSYTTVSHVINKSRPVSDKVRGEVEAAIQRLNYVPSAVARSLKQQSTCTIGLLGLQLLESLILQSWRRELKISAIVPGTV